MRVDLSINPSKTTESIVKFIKETVIKSGFSKLVVGLSGGIDSAVSCSLAVSVLGFENVYVALFPYGNLDREGIEGANLLIDVLRIPPPNVHLVDIKPLVDQFIKTDPGMDDLRKGNIMARTRMILLFDWAKKNKALVLGTENRTEHLLGYFTRFGDSASDIEPIRHLYKTQVRQLAKYLKIPEKIISCAPTAGLWQGQTDEGELGFTYEEADKILYLYTDLRKSIEEIVKSGIRLEVVNKVVKRLKANEFKHR